MAIKYHYTYTEYKDYPTATEISKDRERRKSSGNFCYYFFAFISAIVLFSGICVQDILRIIISLLLLVFFIFEIIYMNKYYDKATERKIKKEIERVIKEKEETKNYIIDSKYKFKSLKHTNKYSKGVCKICFKEFASLELCKAKNDVGTREILICNDCISKIEKNLM